MNIFEQIESCHVIEINGNITDNFSYDSDMEPDEEGYLVVNLHSEDGAIERWYSYRELNDSKEHGEGFIVGKDDDVIEFHILVGVEWYNNLLDNM